MSKFYVFSIGNKFNILHTLLLLFITLMAMGSLISFNLFFYHTNNHNLGKWNFGFDTNNFIVSFAEDSDTIADSADDVSSSDDNSDSDSNNGSDFQSDTANDGSGSGEVDDDSDSSDLDMGNEQGPTESLQSDEGEHNPESDENDVDEYGNDSSDDVEGDNSDTAVITGENSDSYEDNSDESGEESDEGVYVDIDDYEDIISEPLDETNVSSDEDDELYEESEDSLNNTDDENYTDNLIENDSSGSTSDNNDYEDDSDIEVLSNTSVNDSFNENVSENESYETNQSSFNSSVSLDEITDNATFSYENLSFANDTITNVTNESSVFIEIDDLTNLTSNVTNESNSTVCQLCSFNETENMTYNPVLNISGDEYFLVEVVNAENCTLNSVDFDNYTIYDFGLPCGDRYIYHFNWGGQSNLISYACGVDWETIDKPDYTVTSDIPCSVKVYNNISYNLSNVTLNVTQNITNATVKNVTLPCEIITNGTLLLANDSFTVSYSDLNVTITIYNNTNCSDDVFILWDNDTLKILNLFNYTGKAYTLCNSTLDLNDNITTYYVLCGHENITGNLSANYNNIISKLESITNGKVELVNVKNMSLSSTFDINGTVSNSSSHIIHVYTIKFINNDTSDDTYVLFYGLRSIGSLDSVTFFRSEKFNSTGVFVHGNPIFEYANVSFEGRVNDTIYVCSDDNFDQVNMTCSNWTILDIPVNSYDGHLTFTVPHFSAYIINRSINKLNVTNDTLTNLNVTLKDILFKKLIFNQPDVLSGRAVFTVYNPFNVSIPLDFLFDEKGRLHVKRYNWMINGHIVERIPPNYNGTIELYAKFDKPNYRSPPNIDWKPKVIIPYNLIKEKYNLSYSLESLYSQDNTTLKANLLNTSMFNISNVSNSGEININKTEIHGYLKQLIGTNFNITNSGGVEFIMTDWAWWNSTWGHKLKININNTMSSSLSNYQVKIVLNSSISDLDFDDFNSSCKDIRFLNDDEDTELDYWVEYCNVSSEHIEAWVKVPSLPADSITTIWMYYANDDVESTMNGTATFIKFDDFDDGSIDSDWTTAGGTWTESGGYLKQTSTSYGDKHIYQSMSTSDFIVEALLKPEHFGSDKRMGISAYKNPSNYMYNTVIMHNDATKLSHLSDHITWGSQASTGFTYSTGNWYHFKMKIYANSSSTELYSKSWRKHYYEPSSDLIHNTWSDFSTYVAGLNGGQNSNVSFDYFFVHKYAQSEPLVTFGNTYTTPACVNLSDSSTYWDKVVNSSGTYYINKNTTLCEDTYTINIGSSDKAIVINNTNILLDCNNSIIDGVDKEGFGIYSNYNQTNIRNCYVKRYGNSIMFSYSNDSYVFNSTVENNTYNGINIDHSLDVIVNNTNSSDNSKGIMYGYSNNGLAVNFNSSKDSTGMAIYFSNNTTFQYSTIKNSTSTGIIITGDNNTVEHNTIQYVDGKGINIYYNSDYNTIYNNTIKFCGNGIYVESTCTNNNITGNDVTNSSQNGIYFDSSSTSNTLQSNRFCYNNQSGGSYYDYYDADSNSESDTTCDTSSPSGICDNTCAYSGCVNLSDSSTWSGRVAYDSSTNTYYINDNVTLCQDTYNINVGSAYSAIKINASNIFLDCNGSTIDGSDDEGYGIYINKQYVEIKNCIVQKYNYNINVYMYGDYSNIHNNTLNSGGYGVWMYSADGTDIVNNTFDHNGYGIYISYSLSVDIIDNRISYVGVGSINH